MPTTRTTRTWERLAAEDPLRAIVDTPDGDALDAFLASGEREVETVLGALRELGIHPDAGDALDFGCGVGRLSLPLAGRFARVTGIDASPTMVARAQELAASRGTENVAYRLSAADGIPLGSGSQDLVLSLITLQHVPAAAQLGYVREFARLLRPGGTAVVQVVTGDAGAPRSRVRRAYRRLLSQERRNAVRRVLRPGAALPEIYPVSPQALIDATRDLGVEWSAAVEDGAMPGWTSHRLVLRRTA